MKWTYIVKGIKRVTSDVARIYVWLSWQTGIRSLWHRPLWEDLQLEGLWKRKQYCDLHIRMHSLPCVFSLRHAASVCVFVCSCGNKPQPGEPVRLHYRFCVNCISLWYSNSFCYCFLHSLRPSFLPFFLFRFKPSVPISVHCTDL